MERVKKGKKYWYLNDRLFVLECIETGSPIDDARAEVGNYFHSPHKLSDMSFKIEKVLKGADVIETPSEEEIREKASDIAFIEEPYSENNLGELEYGISNMSDSAIKMANWLKSKIVK